MSANPSPIAERLKHARLRAGMTLADVAAQLEQAGEPLTRAALSKYELGKSVPRPKTLMLLARIFGVRSNYFFASAGVDIRWLAFRKHASLTKSRQDQVRAEAADVVSSHVFLEGALHPSKAHGFPKPQRVKSGSDVEGAAEAVRKHWKLDQAVIESVVQTIEDHGGVVVLAPAPVGRFDGLSGWANEKYPVLVSCAEASLDRRRYNVAHELGHIVLDCTGIDEKTEEHFAHRFAAALLVPAAVARRELGSSRGTISLDELAVLKKKYGLSMQAWARRARDLEIIAASAYTRLCIAFSKHGWRKHEPVDFVGNEEPMRLKLLTLRALAEGFVTPTRAAELCPGVTTSLSDLSHVRPAELRKRSREEQDAILERAAAALMDDYAPGGPLRGFEALGDSDFVA